MTDSVRPKRALLAYCALAQRLSSPGINITHALIPFFTEANHDLVGQFFDAEKFSIAVSRRFGFNIPRLAALGLAEQLELAGLLEVVSRDGSRTVYKHASVIPENESVNPVTEAQVERVLSSFFAYCADDEKLKSIERSVMDAAFLHRLLNIDSMKILGRKEVQIANKRTANTLSLPKNSQQVEAINIDELHLDFKTSQFLLDIQTQDREAFNLVSDVAFASMAAEAIAVFQGPADANVPLSGLTVYLDSPILLDMLGVNDEYAVYGGELLATIKASGARVAVFDHCVNEAEGAVSAQLAAIRSGIVSSHRIGLSAKPDLLAALRNRVGERAYERLEIDVERDPEVSLHRRHQNVVGDIETGLEASMQAWKNAEAKDHDRKSVWSMLTMRDSSQPCPRVCDSKWIFLSRNTALVKIANTAWLRWLKGTTTHSIMHLEKWAPIAMSDKQFAGYVWTRTGGSRNTIPVARLLANCSAAVRPRADVKNKAYNLIIELSGKEQADDLAALLEDRECASTLMRAVSGDPEDVTPERIQYIFDQVKLTAGEFAAKQAREEGERILQERSVLFQAEIDRVSQELREKEGLHADEIHVANVESMQMHEDAERLTFQNKLLRDEVEAKEKTEKNRIFIIVTNGFNEGVSTYIRLQWFLAILFAELIAYGGYISTSSPLASWILSAVLGFVSFWFVPEFLNKPFSKLSNSVTLKYIQQIDNSINVPSSPSPDFRNKNWRFLDSLHE